MEQILRQLIDTLSHYLQGFIHPRWCRISSISRTECSDLWLLLVVSCFLFGEAEAFHSMISWSVLPWHSMVHWVSDGLWWNLVHHGFPVANYGPFKPLGFCRCFCWRFSTFKNQSKLINWINPLPDMFRDKFTMQHSKACSKQNGHQQTNNHACPIMSTFMVYCWLLFCMYLYLGDVYLLWSRKFRVKTGSLTLDNVFATRKAPEICYLI